MLKKHFQNIRKYLKSINLKKDNRPVIMLICIIISSVLWFSNSLGKLYETSVSVPIHYTNLPENKVLLHAPPSKIKIKTEAYGSALFQHKIKLAINPVNFNVRSFTNGALEMSDKLEFKIASNNYIDQISKQISSDIKITKILPDTLVFVFDNIVSQKKEVVPDIKLAFEKQHFLSDSIRVIPDSIVVEGPSRIVDTLQFVKTQHYAFKKLNTTINKSFKIQEIKQVKFNKRRADISIPVSFYTEYKASVSVKKDNVPDSLNLVTFPGKVEIKCLVTIDDYTTLTPDNFSLSIDYKQIDPQKNTVDVLIHQIPPYVKSFQYSPHKLEYIIEKTAR